MSKPQGIVVFCLETGLMGVIRLKSSNPNLIPEINGKDNQIYHCPFRDDQYDCPTVLDGRSKSGYNLQLHETFNDMKITAITICSSRKCFYVGTSEGIVSFFKYEVSCDHQNFFKPKYQIL